MNVVFFASLYTFSNNLNPAITPTDTYFSLSEWNVPLENMDRES